jgi:hypothetical protein
MSIALVKSVIGIQNYGSSGSSLLHSLLDGHPELISLPGFEGISFYSNWRQKIEFGDDKNIDFKNLLSWVLDHVFKGLYDPGALDPGMGITSLGPGKNENPCIDQSLFRNRFVNCILFLLKRHDIDPLSFRSDNHKIFRKFMLVSAYCAYNGLFPNNTVASRSLIFPIHSADPRDVQDLEDDFGSVKIIHMIRNPVSNFNSIVKWMKGTSWSQEEAEKSGSNLLNHVITQLFLDEASYLRPGVKLNSITPFHGLESPDISCAVRLEDLHRAPEQMMRGVATWIGISWNDVLLQTTFGGKIWWNRSLSLRIAGFDRAITSIEQLPNVSWLDRIRIRSLAMFVNRRYGYGPDGSRSPLLDEILLGIALMATLWLPFRVEMQATRLDPQSYVRARTTMLGCLVYTARHRHAYVAPLPVPSQGPDQRT